MTFNEVRNEAYDNGIVFHEWKADAQVSGYTVERLSDGLKVSILRSADKWRVALKDKRSDWLSKNKAAELALDWAMNEDEI